jgi:hypothetical protein
MKKNLILMIIGVFGLNLAHSQDYAFKVLANKGSSEVKAGSVWMAIKTGDKLKQNDELKVSENSYVALVHSTGKPVELKEAKTYKVADLASKVGAGTSVLNKYTDFILSSNSEEAKKKNRQNATGAVHRGLKDVNVFLPDKNNITEAYNSNISFTWESKNKGPFVVTLSNMFGDVLFTQETIESSIQIDRTNPKLSNEDALLVNVRLKSSAPKADDDQYLIRKTSTTRQEVIKKSMEGVSGDLKDETALNKFIMAGFYEENHLLIDAITAYQQAIKLAPEVPTYREAYEEFLIRNGLKKLEEKK